MIESKIEKKKEIISHRLLFLKLDSVILKKTIFDNKRGKQQYCKKCRKLCDEVMKTFYVGID